ncbi:MAG TPA: hypothetical protein V6D16_20485 [Candidatus Obscuribacterales bacterium]
MPTPAKKTNKSITFTPEAADQTLLAAIEQALTDKQYDSFSDLCKQALQQALLDTESARLTNSDTNSNMGLEAVLAPIQQQVAQLEAKLLASQSQRLDELNQQLVHTTQQLEALQTQGDRWFSNGKQSTDNPTTEYLNQLTSQLIHLTTQVEAIETKISQQFADLQSHLNQNQPALPVPLPSAAEAPLEPSSAQAGITDAHSTSEPLLVFKEPPSKATIAASFHESDPILSRLSSLLEDF